jgi:hypothetical protein
MVRYARAGQAQRLEELDGAGGVKTKYLRRPWATNIVPSVSRSSSAARSIRRSFMRGPWSVRAARCRGENVGCVIQIKIH